MAPRWEPQLEPEPLALPVKPRKGEAFDSWLNRLTSLHEVTRAQLFEHLKCSPQLAKFDLARGFQAYWDSQDLPTVAHLIDSLAAAVEVPVRRIEATFVPAPQDTLLPPAMRKFACPACWRDALIARQPLIIRREWILRASWQCADHRLPLAPLADYIVGRTPRATRHWLDAQVVAARKLRKRFSVPFALQRSNDDLLAQLLGKPKTEFLRGELGYQQRVQANAYHLSRARIALLMAAHSDRHHLADRFDQFIDLTFPKLAKEGRDALHPKARRTVLMPSHATGKLELVRRSRWQASLYQVLCAYRPFIARLGAARGLK